MKTSLAKNLVVLLVASVGFSTHGYAQKASTHADHAQHAVSEGTKKMHQSMEKMHKDMSAMQMKGETDHDFASMMIHHHQSGIEMAQAEIDHGTDPKLKQMAKKMIKEQSKDIETLKKWVQAHK